MNGFPKLIFSDVQPRTQLDTFTSEATLLAGINSQAVIPSLGFNAPTSPQAMKYRYQAWGYFGTTGTPTFKWIVRLGTVAANDLTGTIIGSTASVTTNSGVTAGTLWHLSLDFAISAPGQGTNNLTLMSFGTVTSGGIPNGVAGMEITAHPTTTWTAASWNALLTYYISLSAVCGSSSGSNLIKCMAQELTELY